MNLNGYNTTGYNVPPTFAEMAPSSLLTFDGFDCHDQTNMMITGILFNSGHKRDVDSFAVPRANGLKVANVREREKIVTAVGRLKAADADALEDYIDTVKKRLRGTRRQLVTRWAGKTRLYEHATLINMHEIFADRKGTDIDVVRFKLQFLCEEFSTNWLYSQWGSTITAAEDTVTASGDGTCEGKPVIIVVFSAASGVTELTVQIDENGQTIGYEGALTAGDVLVFNCENETVTLNGAVVDFIGYFPEMVLDANTFRFTTDGASRTYRATIKTKHAFQ